LGPSIELILLGVLVCIVAYSLLTKAISKTILALPIIFVAIGYVCAHTSPDFWRYAVISAATTSKTVRISSRWRRHFT